MFLANVCAKAFRISAAVLLLSVFCAPAQTANEHSCPATCRTGISSSQPLGRLDGSTRLKLSINLPLHNREALTNLLDQLYDPASPLYHHYLTPEEFDARFGPTESDYQTVLAWATRNGFAITARHPNRMLLEVSASVTDIERALQVTMRTYAHPTEPRIFFAPDTEPSVGTRIPILFIGGLDNFARPHPKNLRRAPLRAAAKATPQFIGSGPNGNLAGFDFRAAYAPGVSLTGTGQMVGLVEFDGYYANDIASYVSQTGVSNVPLQIVLLDGFNGVPTTGATMATARWPWTSRWRFPWPPAWRKWWFLKPVRTDCPMTCCKPCPAIRTSNNSVVPGILAPSRRRSEPPWTPIS